MLEYGRREVVVGVVESKEGCQEDGSREEEESSSTS